MYFVAFDMNCCKRSCRTQILACSASDASFFIYGRNHERLRVFRVFADQSDCSGRTMSCTVAAFYPVSIDDAVCEIHYGMAYLYG